MSLQILLCTDGSTFSRAATKVALQLAAGVEDAHLTALHVVNVVAPSGNILKDAPGRLGFEPAVVAPAVEASHTRHGEDVLAAVARDAELAGVEIQTINAHGAVAEQVAHHARHVGLVIMGLRGSTEDQFPGQGGGHLEPILSRLSVPVLFVGRDMDKVDGVALGYDGSDGAAHALKAVSRLCGPLKLPVHAIYVSPDGSGGQVLDEIDQHYPDLDLHKHVVADSEPHTAIARTAVSVGADVVALGFRGRSPMKDFLYGSAVTYILMNTELMVLVAH